MSLPESSILTLNFMKSFKLQHIFIFLMTVLTAVFPIRAQKWQLYSSFDNNPVKIIDTPDKTFFLVHQQYFRKDYEGYEFPSLALFEYDKAHPDNGIRAMIAGGKMSGADVRLAEYSPAGEYLLVGYHSGKIDLIGKDGAVTTIDALRHTSLPGGSIINTVTFDSATGDAWVATEGGYLHIDAAKRQVTRRGALEKPLSWIGQAGDRLIAISDGKPYESRTLSPRSFSDFTPITISSPMLALMPLSATRFACLSGTAGENVNVIAFSENGDNWSASTLGSDYFHTTASDGTVTQRYEPNIIPNKEGYLLYSRADVWQLKRNAGENEMLCRMQMRGMALPVGSWDMREFWAYEDRGKFRRYHADYDELAPQTTAAWSPTGEGIRPNAPASFISTHINYSPDYGHLVVNHGQLYEFLNNLPSTPVLLSGKKGDDWLVYSQMYNLPRSVEENPGLKQIYLSHSVHFPVPDPHGLAVDPQNPNWVACGSMFGGIFFMDLSDPKKDVIHFAAPNNFFASFPGFVPTGTLQSWDTLSLFSHPEFDSEGRMWVFSGNPFPAVDTDEPKVNVKFMTAEQRKAFYEAAPETYSSLKSWITIGLPLDNSPAWDRLILCGKHPKNKNRVYAFTSGNENTLFILDHHGHPEQCDQIDIMPATHLQDDKGWRTQLRYVNSVAEDPASGDIIIATIDGLFVIEAGAQAKDGVIPGQHLTLRNGTPGDIVPTEAHIFKVIFDPYGRMWVGTRNIGVVGVNNGRTEVIARYNTSNSPIPSDMVTGLGWNPDTGSLMISTDRGLAEVFPDLPAGAANSEAPEVYPNAVRPDYNGAVEIRNLPANAGIVVKDKAGNEVRRFDNGHSTIAEWDLKDTHGKSVPSGIYTIHIGNLIPIELPVMR